MNQDYWHKQNQEPLFPKLLWSRPESRLTSGKLLITGGTKQSFAAPANAHQSAQKAGVGATRTILPDSLPSNVKKMFPDGIFASSNHSGSFSSRSLAELLAESAWADAVFVCNDLGGNSETLVMLEKFIGKVNKTVCLPVSLLVAMPPATASSFLSQGNLLAYGDLNDWQRLLKHTRQPFALTRSMGIVQIVGIFHELQKNSTIKAICSHEKTTIVSVEGSVSTTPSSSNIETEAIGAVVWWLQNTSKPFEAITTSLIDNPV